MYFSMLNFYRIYLFLFLLVFKTSVFSQEIKTWKCYDDEFQQLQKNNTPDYQYLMDETNYQLKQFIDNGFYNKRNENGVSQEEMIYTIPVVVHVLYNEGEKYGEGGNISYFQIRSQIEALNAAFSKNYENYNQQTHPDYAANVQIQFCLAQTPMPLAANWNIGPGGVEYGVKRYPVNSSITNHSMTVQSATSLLNITHPSVDYFPFENYLNIWLVDKIDGDFVMGYAPKPLGQYYPLDGVIMRHDIFGDNTTNKNFPILQFLEQGKVLAHEIGHYLNLYHIFQNGCSGKNPRNSSSDACDLNGDFICDTRPSNIQNVTCDKTTLISCPANYNTGTSEYDMINNYMSYADDDCMNTFTEDQKKRMWATLNTMRKGLWSSQNLYNTGVIGVNGCVPPYLNAKIVSNTGVYCKGRKILFSTSKLDNTATGFAWRFSGGQPSVSANDTVTVTYPNEGNYNVYLTTNDGVNFRTDSIKIDVVHCTLDSSKNHMANWYFGNFVSIDFSSGVPVQTTTALDNRSMTNGSGQTVSLSDSAGLLLFYSNAVSVWDHNHKKVTTSPIFGNADVNGGSAFCYVPYPGQKNKFFLIGADAGYDSIYIDTPLRTVLITIDPDTVIVDNYIDMLNPLLPDRSSVLTVIPHCNGEDYWIVSKGHGQDTKFYSYIVTKDGLDYNQTPVISTGFRLNSYLGSAFQMKSNDKGNKLIVSGWLGTQGGALCDFDNATGVVSKEIIIPNVTGYNNVQLSCTFSPNGDFFYMPRTSNLVDNGKPYWLFQYRVSDLAYNILPAKGHYFYPPFQIGPDNNVYVINAEGYLGRLTNPDVWNGAQFDGEYIYFRSKGIDVQSQASIPFFIDAKPNRPDKPTINSKSINCNTFQFSVTCFQGNNFVWNFGDGTPLETGNSVTHTFAQPGDYTVMLTVFKDSNIIGSNSVLAKVLPVNIQIFGPDTICRLNNYTNEYFTYLDPNAIYEWFSPDGIINGYNNRNFVSIINNTDKDSVELRLKIKINNCLKSVTKFIHVKRSVSIVWPSMDNVCNTDSSLLLNAFPRGGIYSGDGVTGEYFNPQQVSIGRHKINYTYFDNDQCLSTIENEITVIECDVCAGLNSVRIRNNPVFNDQLDFTSYKFIGMVQVYNVLGQKVFEQDSPDNSMKLPKLSSGEYIVRIYCKNNIKSVIRKILIL